MTFGITSRISVAVRKFTGGNIPIVFAKKIAKEVVSVASQGGKVPSSIIHSVERKAEKHAHADLKIALAFVKCLNAKGIIDQGIDFQNNIISNNNKKIDNYPAVCGYGAERLLENIGSVSVRYKISQIVEGETGYKLGGNGKMLADLKAANNLLKAATSKLSTHTDNEVEYYRTCAMSPEKFNIEKAALEKNVRRCTRDLKKIVEVANKFPKTRIDSIIAVAGQHRSELNESATRILTTLESLPGRVDSLRSESVIAEKNVERLETMREGVEHEASSFEHLATLSAANEVMKLANGVLREMNAKNEGVIDDLSKSYSESMGFADQKAKLMAGAQGGKMGGTSLDLPEVPTGPIHQNRQDGIARREKIQSS